jgi:hypothetical protein
MSWWLKLIPALCALALVIALVLLGAPTPF